MSTTKRISGDYNLQTLNPTDKINITSSAVTINGNLFVTGNSQSVVTTNSAISDHVIVLNHGLSNNADPNPLGAAIEVDRGTQANVQIRWNEGLTRWELSNDGSSYSKIITSGSMQNANVNITGYTIYDATANVALYANTVAGGGSGLFVNTGTTQPNVATKQELITKSRALAFSLILG
jgi:hypothetical protein